jgi:integrase
MAKIAKYHKRDCSGASCGCPYRLDFRPEGVRGRRKRIEFPTKKAAEKHLATTATKVSRNEYIEPATVPTFGAVAEEWLHDKADLRPATIQGYRSDVRHLVALHGIRLDRISVALIEGMRDDLRAAGFAPKTVGYLLTTCAAVFKLAMRRGYVTSNPAATAERPRRSAAKELTDADEEAQRAYGLRSIRADEALSAEEISLLLDHTEPGLYRTLFATVAATGLRSEEVYALKWGDVQFDGERPQIFVRRSVSWSRALGETGRVRPKFYPPKTESGYRALPIPAALVNALKAWKLKCPPSDHDLMFCRGDGAPLARSHVLRVGLYPALRRAGLRRVNVKTLRHSYASGLIAAGAPITEVQHRLGHANPGTTLKVYSHWFKDADTGAADRYTQGFLKRFTYAAKPTAEKSGQKVGIDQVANDAQVA